jgi:hypothetical protein
MMLFAAPNAALPWARQMPVGADRLSRDYRLQVRNKVLGFSLSHRRG